MDPHADLGDFSFFRVRPLSGCLVLGFGQTLSLEASGIQAQLAKSS